MNKYWKIFKNKVDIFEFLLLLFAALFLYLIVLGNLPLRDWDEATRALVAREIYRTGNWLHPTLNNQPYMLKPPLMMWLLAISYSLGGINEFTSRLLPAILTSVGIPLLYLIGKEIFTNKLAAIYSALVYLTLLPMVRHGRLAMLDGMVITFFLLSLLCLLKGKNNNLWVIGVGFSLGLVALTKGILVLIFAFIILLFIVFDQQLNILKNYYLWLGLILGFSPVITWYILQWQYYGIDFIQVHFKSQGFERLSNVVEGNRGAIWYYLFELVKYTIPWLLFLPQSLLFTWKNRQKTWAILILTSLIIYFTIISLMKTKLPWYIMPIYPFMALAIGAYLSQIWEKNKIYSQYLLGFFIFLAVAAFGGIIYFLLAEPQPVLILMALVLGFTMGITAIKIKQNDRNFIPVIFIGTYLTLSLLMMSQSWIWELNETFAVKPVASLINKNTPPNTIIYTSFSYNRPSLDFYSDRIVIAENINNLLQKLLNEKVYLLLDESTLSSLNVPYEILGKIDNFILVKYQILR